MHNYLLLTQIMNYSLNNPFYYEPRPLCKEAAKEIISDVNRHPEWCDEVANGKTFGVLIGCRAELPDAGDAAKRIVLWAYSGQILGRSDWKGYVPAVFDYLQPDGFFKQEEARIVAINHEIERLECSPELANATQRLAEVRESGQKEIEDYQRFMAESKSTPMPEADYIKMRQFQKAEFRRLKKKVVEAENASLALQNSIFARIKGLKSERKRASDALQQWLFAHFEMRNANGESRNLLQIFSDWAARTGSKCNVPPSGSGECCAPKLLQYAYVNGIKPMEIAEFQIYNGEPKFIGACMSRCAPILDWMLRGQTVEPNPLEQQDDTLTLAVLYEDEDIIAVDKPAGMLSVPGRSARRSAYDILRQMRPECSRLMMLHRLDMQTSGVLLAAKSFEAYRRFQRYFTHHNNINKVYYALLDGVLPMEKGTCGEISLPLRADYMARPRQLVDYADGKKAVTRYEIMGEIDGHTLVRLQPLTGRTHQLRIHCAHPDGLNCPILGDELYGRKAERMYLHAAILEVEGRKIESELTFK